MFLSPSDEMAGWVKWLLLIMSPVATAIIYVVGKAHGKGEEDQNLKQTMTDVEDLKQQAKTTRDTLMRHQTLHDGYVNMQADVRSTRDCVSRIAGHLGIDGPR